MFFWAACQLVCEGKAFGHCPSRGYCSVLLLVVPDFFCQISISICSQIPHPQPMEYTHRIWCSLSSRFREESKHSQVVCFGGETTRAVNSFMISRVLNRDHSRMARISKSTVKYSVSKCLPLIALIYWICLSTFNSSYFHPNLPLDWMQHRNKRHTPNKKNWEFRIEPGRWSERKRMGMLRGQLLVDYGMSHMGSLKIWEKHNGKHIKILKTYIG